ncbi:hypothetical protein [uncultured Abiotrophia sp.]|uniref:hypothetical protein n=1 Tax=uncultured Abiotrophia sp. TaxID=316094 RepID=UPI0028D0F17D|nr:hypothetical protein [uncultured Abiotrophia sp.]
MERGSEVGKEIKPIETKYNGFKFRSRLEARWAVFFDMIGLKYEYEVEGFEMKGIRYLPDFYIPSLDRWFEIKSTPLSEYEMKKCEEFCFNKDYENIKFSVLVGSPEVKKIEEFIGVMEYVWEWPSEQYPENVRFLAPKELSEKEYYSRFMRGLWVIPDLIEDELVVAATVAREARFEFGERPTNIKWKR